MQYEPRPLQPQPQPQAEVGLAEELRESTILDNEFMDEHRIPMLREAYQKDIDNLQQILSKGMNNPEQSKLIQDRIDVYRQKLEQLELRRSQSSPNNEAKESEPKQGESNPSPPKSKTEASRPRK